MGLANIASRFVEGRYNQYRFLGARAGAPVSFLLNHQRFNASVYEISPTSFSKLGFALSSFIPGVKVYVLNKADFRSFCLAALTDETTSAFYPLSLKGDVDAVRKEEIPHLPLNSRNIVLREGFSKVELVHELLHDIYLGKLFSPEMRRAFTALVADQVKAAHAKGDRDALKFFEGVNDRSKDRHKIKANLDNFFGECFVYAWELMLGYDNPDLGVVPAELKTFLEKYPVNKPAAPQPEPSVRYPGLPAYPV